ncbi:Hypothetical protein EHI5A_118820 [Entamoeba histolytica KU27]|uniref:Methyltransferase domain-containing protein n=1 Tax=Entamoeba histolytica KU27 TaxID=885311 RepID=M2QHC1_ENTHI|nr:Hypothetical protein EHI5A_118820 [Entamoeba histolytica KU27]
MQLLSTQHEILPSSFETYQQYENEMITFLNQNEVCFSVNNYNNESQYLNTEKPTRVLINGIYERINEEWRNQYFDLIKTMGKQYPEQSDIILLNIFALIHPEIKAIIPKKYYIEVPLSLQQFIDKCKLLYPKGNIEGKKEQWILMNEKKGYECKELSSLINQYWKGCVIDIGSGKGYLMEELQKKGIKCIGIEGKEEYVKAMKDRNQKVAKIEKIEPKKDVKVASEYLSSDITSEAFMEIVQKLTSSQEFLMTCLHACGNLTPTLLRLSINIPQIKMICAVGCCYHKLTEEIDNWKTNPLEKKQTYVNEKQYGFPMSEFVKQSIHFHLAHSEISTFADPMKMSKDDFIKMMKQQSFKAVFEFIMYKTLGSQEDHPTGKTKNGSFHEYFESALRNIQKRTSFTYRDKTYNERLMTFIQEYLNTKEPNMNVQSIFNQLTINGILVERAAFIILGALIAPVLESSIVVDRVLYLQQYCKQVSCQRVFDSSISPRCFALIAKK